MIAVTFVGGFILFVTEFNKNKASRKIQNIEGEQIIVGKDTAIIFTYKNNVLCMPKK
jgi:hypothetical protein